MAILEHCKVELKSHNKLYDVKLNSGSGKLKVSYIPNIHETRITSAAKEDFCKKDAKGAFFQCRYLIVAIQFLAFCQINCLRQVTGVSMVAMVTHSEDYQLKEDFNSSKIACPLNAQDIQINTVPDIEGEFGWSPSIQGYILSSSFLGYAITQMPGGMLAEAFGAKYTITFGLFISSVCHFISPFVSRVHSNLMIFTQLVRGMGQGLIPAAHCVVAANWFPRIERGLLNTIVMSGYAVGALVGGVATGLICSTESLGGWPFSYYVFGGLGILLSFSFHFVFFESPKSHPKIGMIELTFIEQGQETDMSRKRPPTPWRQMLCSVPVHALILILFPLFWVGTYALAVQPTFLGTILHFRMQENGVLSSVPFVLQTISTLFASWISNWLQRNNYVGVNKLRKGFCLLCYVGYFVSFMGMYAAGCNKWLSVGFNVLQAIPVGFSCAGPLIVAVDMSPRYAGSVMGLASTLGSTGGFILPIVVGALTNNEQTLEQWNKVFCISAAISMGAAFIFCAFGSGDVQSWNFDTTEAYENYKVKCKDKNGNAEELRNNVDSVSHL